MNLTLGTIDLDALDVDQLRAHRHTLERGIRIIDALTTALDPAAPPPPAIEPPAPEPEPEPERLELPPPPAPPPPPPPAEPESEPEPAVEPAGPDAEPAPAPAPGGPRGRALKVRADIAAALERLPAGEWVGSTIVATEAGVSTGTAIEVLRELLEAGELEHNGKGGAWSKYRRPVASGPELEQEDLDVEDLDDDDDVLPPPPVAPPLSPRVRKLEASANGRAPAGPERSASTLTPRQEAIVRTLEVDALTARQLALAMVANVHDVGTDLRVLSARGLVRLDGDEWTNA